MCGGARAVTLRYGRQYRVELGTEIKVVGQLTQPDDFAADRQRCQQLRPLQRRRLIRYHREPGADAALPVVGGPPGRDTAQTTQGQRQQPGGTECWRQGWQEAE